MYTIYTGCMSLIDETRFLALLEEEGLVVDYDPSTCLVTVSPRN